MDFISTVTQGIQFNGLWDIVGVPMQFILNIFNYFCAGNYALAIFIFTIAINACMFPLNIKQQKTMADQHKLRPKLDKLKEKCGDDKMKYQTAMTELYQQEGISPTGGCMPMVLRMLVLMGVYQAVINLSAVKGLNMILFGLDLTQTPKFSTDIIGGFQMLWLIPLFSFATSMFSSVVSMSLNKSSAPQQGSMKGMMLLMPLMSLYIAFRVPGAVGFYWICSNLVNCVLQVIVTKMYSAEKLNAIEIAKTGAARRKKEKALLDAQKDA